MNGTTATTAAIERREFGHLYQRGATWWVRYRVDGQTYRESAKSADVRKADKLLAKRQAELGLGAFLAPDIKRTTVADLKAIIEDDYAVNRRKSADGLAFLWNRLLAAFPGTTRAHTVTPDRLSRYVADRLAQEAAPSTIRNELSALKRAFRLASRAQKVAQVPAFPTINPGPPRSGFLEDADLPVLLAALAAHLRPLVQFLALTGWRVGEALGLTWDRVDFAHGVVTLAVGSTKTGAGRTFPFDVLPELKALLKAQRDATTAVERRTGQIVPSVFHRDGRPIRSFRDAWLGAIDRAAHEGKGAVRRVVRPQLVGLLVHDLRRSAVRRFVRAGIPERVAMSLTGHKTRSVFDRYNIVSERDLAENVAKLAAVQPVQKAGAR